jgi:tRNA nucleotidyltransferase/poly(A) polymerase|tara:strand:+ start:2095 stop:2400 length:306 start_codon:yes stop_codon:yes gene_type:complete
MTQTIIHNIHPSFADEQKRRAVFASLGGKPFDDDAAFERLTKQVERIKSALTPERIQSEVEKAIRPLRAEAALMEKEQIANADYAEIEDFSDVDLNAMMEE